MTCTPASCRSSCPETEQRKSLPLTTPTSSLTQVSQMKKAGRQLCPLCAVVDSESCSATGELVCEERAIPSAIRGFRRRHKQEGGSDDSSPSDESENDDPLITDVDVSFCERSDATTSEQRVRRGAAGGGGEGGGSDTDAMYMSYLKAAQRMPNLTQLDARRFVYYAGEGMSGMDTCCVCGWKHAMVCGTSSGQDRLKRNTMVVMGALFDGQLDTSTCVSYIVSRLDPYIRDRKLAR